MNSAKYLLLCAKTHHHVHVENLLLKVLNWITSISKIFFINVHTVKTILMTTVMEHVDTMQNMLLISKYLIAYTFIVLYNDKGHEFKWDVEVCSESNNMSEIGQLPLSIWKSHRPGNSEVEEGVMIVLKRRLRSRSGWIQLHQKKKEIRHSATTVQVPRSGLCWGRLIHWKTLLLSLRYRWWWWWWASRWDHR